MADNVTLPATGVTIATDDIAGVQYPLTKISLGSDGVDDGPVSSSNPMPVALPGAAQDLTVQALQELNDTMLYMLGAILEKMPRVTGNDQAAVSIEAGSVSFNSNQTVATVTTVGTVSNMTNIGGRHTANVADAMTMSGTTHIYNNITVS